MNPAYIHELADWPNLTWDQAAVAGPLAAVVRRQGRLIGRMESLGFPLRVEAVLETLTLDVIKSSDIEGEVLDRDQVRSSIARRLGMDIGALAPVDRNVEGVVEMMLDATQRHADPVTAERLFAWHASLFPTGRSGMRRIIVGAWRDDRDGPMQVVSGPVGRERVHFEAPAAPRLPEEMQVFLTWFNAPSAGLDLVLKAATAHLWFLTIHPFEDGNGRIARALADLMLARSEGSAQRFYSMSASIRADRKAYYALLERTQKGSSDITPWCLWFFERLDGALDGADHTLSSVLDKARRWEAWTAETFNPRQRRMLNLLLDGLDGKLSTSKWAKLSKCSQDTALRDITDLVSRGVLASSTAGGRSTSYDLV